MCGIQYFPSRMFKILYWFTCWFARVGRKVGPKIVPTLSSKFGVRATVQVCTNSRYLMSEGDKVAIFELSEQIEHSSAETVQLGAEPGIVKRYAKIYFHRDSMCSITICPKTSSPLPSSLTLRWPATPLSFSLSHPFPLQEKFQYPKASDLQLLRSKKNTPSSRYLPPLLFMRSLPASLPI